MLAKSAIRILAATFALVVIFATGESSAKEYYWTKIWGPVKLYLANKSGEYAVKLSDKNIYQRHVNKKTGKSTWTRIGGPGKEFAVTSTKLYGLSPDSSGVFEYSGTPGQWTKVGGAAKHIYAGVGGLYATNPTTGDIWAYELRFWENGATRVHPGWTKVGGPGAMFAVGGTKGPSNYPRLYGLSPNRDSVWEYGEKPMEWKKIGGPAANIWAQSRTVYATDPTSGDVFGYRAFLYTQQGAEWIRLGGPGLAFAAHEAGGLYGLSFDNKIRHLGTSIPGSVAWEVVAEPSSPQFDRIFVGLFNKQVKAREKGTKALWSLELGDAPRRTPPD